MSASVLVFGEYQGVVLAKNSSSTCIASQKQLIYEYLQ